MEIYSYKEFSLQGYGFVKVISCPKTECSVSESQNGLAGRDLKNHPPAAIS